MVQGVHAGSFFTLNYLIQHTMTRKEALEKLCYYDKRNPNSMIEDEDRRADEDCYCDNCFYGRTALAEEILRLMDENDNLQYQDKDF